MSHAEKATTGPIYAIDFGTGDALAIHGPDGPVSKRSLSLPRVKGGKTQQQEFIMIVEALFRLGDVVVESATIGASGCEVQDVVDLLERVNSRNQDTKHAEMATPDIRRLFTLSCRAVKNYRADHGLKWAKGARYAKDGQVVEEIALEEQAAVHQEDAEIIYRIATEHPKRLYHWTGPSFEIERIHTSVRPMDKRGYRDERAEHFMSLLPSYESLPSDLMDVLGNGKGYSRSKVMPFAMASTEPHIDAGPRKDRRQRYENVIGLKDHGYPTFYRRATIVWMQDNAKFLAGTTRIGEVDPATRKEAWRVTQRQIRRFFHLTMAHQGR